MILLDSGQSRRGWSAWGDAFKCPMLYALKRHKGVQDTSEATTKGSMGHVGIAHLMARHSCQQNGWDFENTYYQPEDAIKVWTERNPHGREFLDQMVGAIRAYSAQHPTAPGRILSIETMYVLILGWKGERWGLWLVSDASLQAWPGWGLVDGVRPGEGVRPHVLEMPGHKDHGRPIEITKRIDLVVQEPDRKVWAWDHKFKMKVTKGTVHEYFMDGQFAVTRIVAMQAYGVDLGGTRLNLVQSDSPYKVIQPRVPETPHRDGLFARHLFYKAHELARLERDVPIAEWPMTQNELVCRHRYGACIGQEINNQPGFCALGI